MAFLTRQRIGAKIRSIQYKRKMIAILESEVDAERIKIEKEIEALENDRRK